jgi:3-phytase
MKAVDNGGIEMFVGETGFEYRDLMGISIYTAKDGKMYAVVGRKTARKPAATFGNTYWEMMAPVM